jgi:hypothetical protein
MPNLPLASTAYPSIRAALDVSLDSTVLPDATIGLAIFQGAAEADVERQDPQWATRTGADATAIQNAAIYYTAARIAPSIPNITGEAIGDSSYRREAVDWTARAAWLRSQGDAALASILTPTTVPADRPTFFAVAAGCRGR